MICDRRVVESLEPRRLLSGAGGALVVPALSSLPSAAIKLYLDFDGHRDGWGSPFSGVFEKNATTPAYDIDGDTTDFSDEELENIRQIHQIVSEKFSPFAVDVTTIDPGPLVDGRTGKVVLGGDGAWYGSGGGVAQLDGFWGWLENVGFMWSSPDNVRYIAEGAAHEFGHMLGLSHQSTVSAGTVTREYRPGPIMGRGDLDTPGGRWVIGDATGRDWFDGSLDRRGIQDDVATLLSKGLPLRADDHGNARTLATSTAMASTATGFASKGVIETEGDVDYFRFNAPLGSRFTVRVDVDSLAPMLDPRLEIYRTDGSLVAQAQTSSYGESIEIMAADQTLYWVAVRPGGNAGNAYNIGSYSVVMERYDPADDTPAGAQPIGGVDGQFDAFYAYGRHQMVDFVGSGDEFDWYRFQLTDLWHGSSGSVRLSNLSSNADVYVLRDMNRNGVIELDSEDVVASGTNASIVAEQVSFQPIRYKDFYIAVRHRGGADTSYTLTLTVDGNQPPVAHPLRYSDGAAASPVYDFITPGDTDSYGAPSSWSRGLAYSTIDLEFEPYDAGANLLIGYDADGDRVLDEAEVESTRFVLGGSTLTLNNLPGRNASRHILLLNVKPAVNSTNYRLSWSIDAMPTIDPDLLGARPLVDLGLSRHGLVFRDVVDAGDTLDLINLGSPAPGELDIRIESNSPYFDEARFRLIRDVNQDGKIGQNEIVGEGSKFTYQIDEGDPTPFYLAVEFDPQAKGSVDYEVILRDGFVTSASGQSLLTPRLLLPAVQGVGTTFGYVAFSDNPLLDRQQDFHRLNVDKPGTLNLKLSPDLLPEQGQTPGTGGAEESLGAGLFVVRDLNNNGQIDHGEHIAGYAGEHGATSLSVNVEQGSYIIGILIALSDVPEHTTQALDYRLDYSLDEVSDTTPVEVVNAEFRFEELPLGLFVKFSEDVEMTLGAGDVVLEWLTPNGAMPVPFNGQIYDPDEATLFVGMNRALPDGNYRLRVKAGGVADPAGNLLGKDFVHNFHILAADANRDRTVDFADFLILRSNFGRTDDPPFSKADFNWDGRVDFADFLILRSKFGASVPAAGSGSLFADSDADADEGDDTSGRTAAVKGVVQ